VTKASERKRAARGPVGPSPSADPSDAELAKALALRAAGNIGAARKELARVERSGGPSAAKAATLRKSLGVEPGAVIAALAVLALILFAAWAGLFLRR
jgi:hypothetical protein